MQQNHFTIEKFKKYRKYPPLGTGLYWGKKYDVDAYRH